MRTNSNSTARRALLALAVTLSSAVFADGHYEGEPFGMSALKGHRAHHAEEHGHPEEAQALKPHGGSK